MFLNYMNAFRALAIFFIVFLHTMHVFSWDNNQTQDKILRILFANGTIFFVFISGYLFQHLSAKFSTNKYYVSKFKNVILPYIVISLPVVLYFVFISPKHIEPEFIAMPEWLQIIHYYWFGLHIYPMWFIPTIALFFLAGPIFYQIDKHAEAYWIIPSLIIISLITPRSLFPTDNFLHFLSIYVLGMFCSRYKEVINQTIVKNNVIFVLFMSFVSLFLIEYFAFISALKAVGYLQKLALIFFTLSLLVKFQKHTHHAWIATTANASFGIYFVHAYVLAVCKLASNFFNQYFLNNSLQNIPGNIIIQLIASGIVLIMSIWLVNFIKNVLGDKTYLLIGNIPQSRARQANV